MPPRSRKTRFDHVSEPSDQTTRDNAGSTRDAPLARGGQITRYVQKSPHLPFSGDELRTRLRAYDRQPFLELLAGWMECAPSEDAIRAFAERSPDKYVMAMSQVARIAGFTEKTEVTNNVHVTVGKMSDSQLEDRLRALQKKLGLDLIVDAEFTDVSNPTTEVSEAGSEEPEETSETRD